MIRPVSFFNLFVCELPTVIAKLCVVQLSFLSLCKTLQDYKSESMHLFERIGSIYHRWVFREYLVQETINLPRLDILKSGRDREKGRFYLGQLRERMRADVNIDINTLNENDIDSISNLDGVCASSVYYCAGKILNSGEQLENLATRYSEGFSSNIAGMQLLYGIHNGNDRLSPWSPKDVLTCQNNLHHKLITLEIPNDSASIPASRDRMLSTISRISNGIYAISFGYKGRSEGHATLIVKKENTFSVFDPMIGLLRCSTENTNALMMKVLSSNGEKVFLSHLTKATPGSKWVKTEGPMASIVDYKWSEGETKERSSV